jgi:cell division protein FtsL
MSHRTGIGTLDWSPTATKRRARVRSLSLSVEVASAVGLGLLICGLCFLYVRQETMIRYLTAECATVQEELTEAQEVNQNLSLEIDQAFSLSRIQRLATQLGMIEPSNPRYVHISPDDLP